MFKTSSRIAVLGAGAIGSSVAADLVDAGLDIDIVDQWPGHVEAIRREGLHILMKDRDVRVRPQAWHVADLASLGAVFDLVLLAAKSYDTEWMTHLIRPYLAADGVVVGLQNSMNNDTIADIVGGHRTLGCVIELSAQMYTPALVQRNMTRTKTWISVGERSGERTARVEAIRDILRHVAEVHISDNIEGAKWTKLVANAMTMGPFGLLGVTNKEAAEQPGMADVSMRIGREALAVGQALGYMVEPIMGVPAERFFSSDDDMLVAAMETLLARVGGGSTTAIVQDRRKGRRTEHPYITGHVVNKARDVAIPVPVNDAVLQISDMIDAGKIAMEVGNLSRLREMVGSPRDSTVTDPARLVRPVGEP